MKSVWYNNQKVCDLTPLEYEAICLLMPYWGLQIEEDRESISGALSTFMLGIQGLSPQKVKELNQLLRHTGISITTDDHVKCDQRFYVDFHSNHPMPLALNTPNKKLYYINPATSFQLPVQSGIHKGITLKRKDGPLFLAVQPSYEKQIAEWISYLVIQSFMRFSFESLSSISESTFLSCAEKVLNPINNSFAAVQVPERNNHSPIEPKVEKKTQPNKKPYVEKTEKVNTDIFFEKEKLSKSKILSGPKSNVPQIRPFSAKGTLITNSVPKLRDESQFIPPNAQPINPFKSKAAKHQPIRPFHTNSQNTQEKHVMRPFQKNQNTPSSDKEYTDKESTIFNNQRRDGK
jgi:hypothetical protein